MEGRFLCKVDFRFWLCVLFLFPWFFLSLSTVTSSCISSPERLKEKEAAASTAQVSYDVWIVWCLLIGRLWFFGGVGAFLLSQSTWCGRPCPSLYCCTWRRSCDVVAVRLRLSFFLGLALHLKVKNWQIHHSFSPPKSWRNWCTGLQCAIQGSQSSDGWSLIRYWRDWRSWPPGKFFLGLLLLCNDAVIGFSSSPSASSSFLSFSFVRTTSVDRLCNADHLGVTCFLISTFTISIFSSSLSLTAQSLKLCRGHWVLVGSDLKWSYPHSSVVSPSSSPASALGTSGRRRSVLASDDLRYIFRIDRGDSDMLSDSAAGVSITGRRRLCLRNNRSKRGGLREFPL